MLLWIIVSWTFILQIPCSTSGLSQVLVTGETTVHLTMMCFETMSIIVLEVYIIRWINYGHKGLHGNSTNILHVVAFKQSSVGFKCPVCAKKTFPTLLHQQQCELLTQGSWYQRFMLWMPNSDPTICVLQHEKLINQRWLCFSNFPLSSLFKIFKPVSNVALDLCSWRQEWIQTWPCTVVQGCIFQF